MAIDTETMQIIERCVARAVANATSLKGAADEIAKGVTQYVGARYVPLFAEPLEWDKTRTYEPLTIVLHHGASYTSRQYVPVGVEIDNDSFWALTGNYNAQVEQYRQEVKSFDGRITANKQAITTEKERAESAEHTLQENINTEKERAESAEHTLQENINTEKERATTAEDSIKLGYNRVYDTVESMKNDTSIKEGMICKTIGYRAVNDLGGGVYKINNDVSNGYEKISVSNNLNATLLIENNTVNVDCFGAYGDNKHDDADVLNYAVNFCCDKGVTLTLSAKHYKISHGIVLNDVKQTGVNIQGQGVYKTYITTDNNIVMFKANTLIRCNIGGFNIESSNSNSTCFMCGVLGSTNNICHFSTFHDINYNHCNGFVLNACAYMTLNNCRGGTTDDGVATVGYYLNGEYIYLNECSGGECYNKAESIAFDLNDCNFAYLNKCDSAQNWNGTGLRMRKCNKVYVNNHSFSRNKKNIYLDYSDAIIMCKITCDIFNDGNLSKSTDVTLTRSVGKTGIIKDCIIKINETCVNFNNIKSVECTEPITKLPRLIRLSTIIHRTRYL